ncbi:astacin, partial [Teladorsagia circumcincta]
PGHNGDFGKYIPKTNDNFGLLYDYGSIMHYAAADYSTNGQLTLRPLDYNYVQTIGGPFIGFVDYYMMNFLYNCTVRGYGKLYEPRPVYSGVLQ